MYKFSTYIVIGIALLFAACTEVINVDVPVAEARLVVEASIDWEKGTNGNTQIIKLSSSTPYFAENKSNGVSNASVSVTDNNSNQEFTFVDQQNGEYLCTDFIPVLNHSYTLNIEHNGENYTAVETLMSVTEIDRIEQSVEDGFDDEVIELNMYVPDPADEENYYLIKFQEEGDLLPELFDVDDEFVDGNEMKFFIEKLDDEDTGEEEFETGDVVHINLYGISEAYYNYIRILIEQTETGDIFSTIPVAIKGNCINEANPDNYAFGYFRLTQVDKVTYTVE
ncbi:MAG: DUF4249 domain-containing protein [Labilibaculum sp.]|nr:DUF4249 domain-containing protein [Labilibaculum sp.]MBI9058481.1 DUF4249 domain-containing protein [Labilibaculum sp.]